MTRDFWWTVYFLAAGFGLALIAQRAGWIFAAT
jgi:hypothetical protein